MSASVRFRVGATAAGLCCLLLGYAVAQQVQTSNPSREGTQGASGQSDRSSSQQGDRSTARRGEQTYGTSAQQRTAGYRGAQQTAGGASSAVDHFLAACLLAQNKGEVELSQLAQQKAENSQVKQFAQQMIEDHQKMIEKLQPLAGMQGGAQRGVSGAYGAGRETERNGASRTSASGQASGTTALPGSSGAGQTIESATTTGTSAGSTTADRMAAGGAMHQLMQIDRQINDRCLQLAKEELQGKSSTEFDKCYIGQAIGAHMHALAALEVIGQQTQGQLAQVAQEAQPTVKQHLERAKQLAKQLEGSSATSGRQAERSTRTERE